MRDTTAPPATIVEFLNARYEEFMAGMNKVLADYGSAMTPHLRGKFNQAEADIMAKRKIIDRCQYITELDKDGRTLNEMSMAVSATLILHDLADVYRDHPDYREEWKP